MVLVRDENRAGGSFPTRRAELAHNITRVRERIEQACRAVGRTSAEITLIAVTKTFPASDVALLVELGLNDVAENRDDAAREKVSQLKGEQLAGLRWHFVGQLQRNKCRSVAAYADVVHSVDRPQLVEALARSAGEVRKKPLAVLLQINLDHIALGQMSHSDYIVQTKVARQRGGVAPQDAMELARLVSRHSELALRGVMGIAPLYGDPFATFSQLREVSARLRAVEETASWISAGMSGDLDQAIAAGATHVRVGSALLGIR